MPYMKDEMKKKDSEKLEEMQDEINDTLKDSGEQPLADQAASDKDEDKDNEEVENDAEALAKQLEDGKKALSEAQDRFMRLQADFANFRRRSSQEKADISNIILEGFIKDMLPILDNFERALLTKTDDYEAFLKGIKMIFDQFQQILTKNGLETIKTEGAKFDPNFHQAVMRVVDKDKEDDSIEQELQKGYMVHGHVVRPAMVKVVSN